MTTSTITFFELTGTDARDALAAFGAQIAQRGTPCELMASTTQEHLYLLVCRGAPSTEHAPADARTWAFEPIERFA